MQNIPEFSVSEITNLTKNILEDNFSLIRVKGEISKVKDFKGHYYFSLKDENFVLNSVCWSRNVPFLNMKPEEGMEVFAQGKLTTYAKGSISNYQLQVDQIEAQGEGALLKILKKTYSSNISFAAPALSDTFPLSLGFHFLYLIAASSAEKSFS